MRVTTGLMGLFLLAGTAGATDLYKWKDAQGVTHYSQSPPTGQKYESRRIENNGGVSSGEETAPAKESPNCTNARLNLKILSSKGPVGQDTDGDGKPDAPMSEAQRDDQRNLAEAAVRAYCVPEAASKPSEEG